MLPLHLKSTGTPAGLSRQEQSWAAGRSWHSQDELSAVVSPPQDEVLLPPLHEVGQHIPSPSIRADDVFMLPDLQANQHDADVQHNVHLGRKRGGIFINIFRQKQGLVIEILLQISIFSVWVGFFFHS